MLCIVVIHHLDDYVNHLFQNKNDKILTYSLLLFFYFFSERLATISTDVDAICSLFVVGGPLVCFVSYLGQKQYDLFLTKLERGRVS